MLTLPASPVTTGRGRLPQRGEQGQRLLGLRPYPLVGRRPEQEALWDAVRRVSETGSAELLAISGDSGMGKTSVIKWLKEETFARGLMLPLRVDLRARVSDVSPGMPAALAEHLGTRYFAREDVEAKVQSFMELTGEAAELEVRRLTDLLCASGTDPEGPLPVQQGFSQREEMALLWRTIERISQERLVLLWLDHLQGPAVSSTCDFVSFLLDLQRHTPLPILVVAGIGRDDAEGEAPGPSAVRRMLSHERTSRLDLPRIGRDDLRVLLEEVLGLARGTSDDLARLSDGNPLFCVQLFTHWTDTGALRSEDGALVLDGDGAVLLPESFTEIWRSRVESVLAGLKDRQVGKEVLFLAALLADGFDSALLRGLLTREGPPQLVEAMPVVLDRLVASGLLLEDEPGEYSFQQGSLREALLGDLWDLPDRPLHHLRCAEALVARYSANVGNVADLVAEHYMRAEQYREAFTYSNIAQKTAAARSRFEECLAHLGKARAALDALGVSGDDVSRLQLLLDVGESEKFAGRLDRAEKCVEQAREGAASSGDELLQARLAALQGEVLRRSGRSRAAEPWLIEAVGRFRHGAATREECVNLWRLGECLMARGDLEDAERRYRQGLEVAFTGHHVVQRAQCLAALGEIEGCRDRPEEAARMLAEALIGFQEVGNRHGVALCRGRLGDLARTQGRLADADREHGFAMEEMIALGDEINAAVERGNVALVKIATGEFSAASELLRESLAVASRAGDRLLERSLLCILAHSTGAEERWDRALTLLDAEARLARQQVDIDPDAPDHLEKLGTLAEGAERWELAARAFTQAAEAWRFLGRTEEAERLGRRAAETGGGGATPG